MRGSMRPNSIGRGSIVSAATGAARCRPARSRGLSDSRPPGVIERSPQARVCCPARPSTGMPASVALPCTQASSSAMPEKRDRRGAPLSDSGAPAA